MRNIAIFSALLLLASCTNTTPQKQAPQAKTEGEVFTHVPDSQFCATIARIQRPTQAVGVRSLLWKNGQTIKIKLVGGTAKQRQYITDAFTVWAGIVNLNFQYVTSGKSDVRISFVSGAGSWSYIGTDNLGIPSGSATMNIGWSGLDVCLHEIGHMLGMGHEQANPNGGIKWNKPVVYAALAAPPNNWSREMVDSNVFFKYDTTQVYTTPFDGVSIMQYAIPDSWVLDGHGYPGGTALSADDIRFMSGIYPKAGTPSPGTVTMQVGRLEAIVRCATKATFYADSVKLLCMQAIPN